MSDRCKCCGQSTPKVRSGPEHNHAFALVAAAFAQWPEQHRFTPDNAEHLRAWLTCAAKHRHVTVIERGEDEDEATFDKAVARTVLAFRKLGKYAWDFRNEVGALLVIPKSWAKDECTTAQFRELHNAIAEIIEAEIGVPADKLLKEHERAA